MQLPYHTPLSLSLSLSLSLGMHSLLAIHAQTKNQQNNKQNYANKIATSESQENLRHQSIQRIAENCGTGVFSENCDGDSNTEREREREKESAREIASSDS